MKERYHLIDSLRGLAVVNMVAYHFLFDLYILQGFLPTWRGIPAVHIWQQSICWTFLLVSGVAWHLSTHRWKNGLILVACGVMITAVTVLIEPEEAIHYGVLTLLGCSLLIATALKPLIERIPALPGAIVSFFVFLFTYRTQIGTWGIGSKVVLHLPAAPYQSGGLTIVGFPAPGFYSSDYFPLLPWFFLYLTGLFLGRMLLKNPPQWLKRRVPVLNWVGRQSLLIYLIHQPVAMVVATLIGMVAR